MKTTAFVKRAAAALLTGIGMASAAAAADGTKRALLVGINDFMQVRDLNGTHNDVDAMSGLLVNRFGFERDHVRILKDSQATYAGIEQAIKKELIAASGPDDVVVIYFSSHGSRAPDDSGDEADGWDETLVAHDSRTPGVYDIRDDDFGRWMLELSRRTPNVTVILDTCNSGTGARANLTARFVPPDSRLTPPATLIPTSSSRDGLQEAMPLGANFVLISGSAAEEFSNEDLIDGSVRGVMTHYLVRELEAAPRTSYRTMFRPVALRVNALFSSQHPQIEGNGLDSVVFGDTRANNDVTVFVDPGENGTVTLQAGSLFGVRKDARIAIYEPGDTPIKDARRLADATIVEVRATTALAQLDAAADIPPGARARLGDVLLTQKPIAVYLGDGVDAALREQLTQQLPKALTVLEEGASVDEAGLVLNRTSTGWQILGRDRTPHATLPLAADALQISSRLAGWGRWEAVRELRNPVSQLRVDFDLSHYGVSGHPAPTRVRHNTLVKFTVKNNSTVPLYFNILDITSLGAITRIFPAHQGEELRLDAGAPHSDNVRLTVPTGAESVTDTLLLLATTSPFDATVFSQGRQRSDRPAGALDAMFLAWGKGSRDASVGTLDDWVVRSQSIEVSRTGLDRGDVRFAVHTDAGDAALRGKLETGRSTYCGAGSAPGCISLVPLSTDEGVFEVEAPKLQGRRGDAPDAPTAIGALFEQAYQLREQTGADYVEPLLSVYGEERTTGITTRGGDEETFGLAENEPRWSLNYANVPAAWQSLKNAGRPDKREAQGVLVAHIDTGYTTHPEMVDEAHPPVLTNRGYNYLNNSDDAKDPRTSTGTLKHPGHGTAAGSVIVSPDGCQLPGKTKCATGSGRGAQLIPIRLNDSVVNFSQAKLSHALFDIAEGRRGPGIQAISLAMGGPPSLSLWKATRAVEKKGILLFAAAGNYVQTVVWPARFDAAIAVSAINPACRPWRHASHGSAVDISAPGQGVWRATFQGEQADVGMGAGTTFATGTMAGVGALWLAHHRDSPQLAQLRADGELTATFRRLAQQTSWRPDVASDAPSGVSCSQRWDTDYGTGIVDAAALLAAPLPRTRGLSAAAEPPTLPLYASLYPEGTASAQVAADFRILVGGSTADVASFQTEILYHYAQTEEVRRALDALVAGDRSVRAYHGTRQSLLAQDLSQTLRARLDAAGG